MKNLEFGDDTIYIRDAQYVVCQNFKTVMILRSDCPCILTEFQPIH